MLYTNIRHNIINNQIHHIPENNINITPSIITPSYIEAILIDLEQPPKYMIPTIPIKITTTTATTIPIKITTTTATNIPIKITTTTATTIPIKITTTTATTIPIRTNDEINRKINEKILKKRSEESFKKNVKNQKKLERNSELLEDKININNFWDGFGDFCNGCLGAFVFTGGFSLGLIPVGAVIGCIIWSYKYIKYKIKKNIYKLLNL